MAAIIQRESAIAMANSSTDDVSVSGPITDPEKAPIESPGVKDERDGGELARTESQQSFQQYIGVSKIEALYLVFGKGWKLVALWVSMGLIAYVWSLAAITTAIYSPFATSAFGKHTVVGTMGVINNIMAAVALPFLSKICDVLSRPAGLAFGTSLFTLGYVVVASTPTIYGVAAGEAIFTAGRTGIYQIMHLLISDLTPLRLRGLFIAAYALPWVMNGFLAGEITANIRILSSTAGSNAWRWGYGMFAIIIPVAIGPSMIVLFWSNRRSKKLGALSLTSSTQARREILEREQGVLKRSWWETLREAWGSIDGTGLVLFCVSLSLLLTPPTLEAIVEGGNSNPSLIAMYAVGAVAFIAFLVWDCWFASSPIWPRRLMNRTFLICVFIDALHFFSTGLMDAYYNSWLYIIKPQWSSRHYTYFSTIHNVGLCVFAFMTGALMFLTKRYRWLQISGLVIRTVGEGINYYAASNRKDVTFVMGKILIACGAGMIVTTTAVAAPASVPHKDLAGAMTVLHMVAQVTGSIAGSIGASVWNKRVPANLAKYLPDTDKETRAKIFGNIWGARLYKPHSLIVEAYSEAVKPLLAAAIGTTGIALILALFCPEIKLDHRHNDVEKKEVRLRNKDQTTDEAIKKEVEVAEQRAREKMGAPSKHI